MSHYIADMCNVPKGSDRAHAKAKIIHVTQFKGSVCSMMMQLTPLTLDAKILFAHYVFYGLMQCYNAYG